MAAKVLAQAARSADSLADQIVQELDRELVQAGVATWDQVLFLLAGVDCLDGTCLDGCPGRAV
jgi:hypothetical protein